MIDANVGSLTITSAGGTGNKTYAHGLNSTPKVLLLWTTFPGDSGRAANDFSISFGVGISSTKRRCVWCGSQNALDPSQADSRSRDDKCLMIYNGSTPTLICDADLVSFDGTNITLNITTAPVTDTVVFFMALGGDDLTDYELVTFTQPSSTGNFDITTVGFQGDFLLLFSTNATALDTNTAHASFNIGFCDGTNAALASVLSEDGSASSDTRRYIRTAAAQLEILAQLSNASDVCVQRNSFVSWLSNGFRLNAVETTATAVQIFALVLKGGKYNVGNFLTQTSTGNFSKTGLPFLPKALFMVGNTATAQQTVDVAAVGARCIMGAATSSSARGCAYTVDTDASTTNITKRQKQSTTRCLIEYVATDPPTLDGDADFVSFNSDGFTLNQTDALPSQGIQIFFVVGSFPRPALTGTLATAGGLNKKAQTPRAGTLTSAGAISRKTMALKAGTLAAVGALQRVTKALRSGVLGLAGALAGFYIPGGQLFQQAVDGTLALAGIITRKSAIATAAALSFASTVAKKTSVERTGALSFVGTIVNKTKTLRAGTLAFAGGITRKTSVAKVAVLTFSSQVSRKTSTAFTAVLSFASAITVTRRIGQQLVAALTFDGALTRKTQTLRAATLNFSGQITRTTMKALTAALNFIGTMVSFLGLPALADVIYRAPPGETWSAPGDRVFKAPALPTFKVPKQ